MNDVVKRCLDCGQVRPHGPNQGRANGLQVYCRECLQLRGCHRQMLNRCTDPEHPKFRLYGARGIRVCARWFDFHTWRRDMGPRPEGPRYSASIERIDNDGDYEPSNCRWATPTEQCNNSSKNRLITFNGETLTLIQWSRRTGLHKNTLQRRLDRGWSDERALLTPPRKQKGKGSTDELEQMRNLREWGFTHQEIAETLGRPQPTVSRWLRKLSLI